MEAVAELSPSIAEEVQASVVDTSAPADAAHASSKVAPTKVANKRIKTRSDYDRSQPSIASAPIIITSRSRPASSVVRRAPTEAKPGWCGTLTLESSQNERLPKASRVYFRESIPSVHVDPLAQLNPQLRGVFNRAAAAYMACRDPAYSTSFRADSALQRLESGFDTRAAPAAALLSHKRFMYRQFRDAGCPSTIAGTSMAPTLPPILPVHRAHTGPSEAYPHPEWYYTECGGKASTFPTRASTRASTRATDALPATTPAPTAPSTIQEKHAYTIKQSRTAASPALRKMHTQTRRGSHAVFAGDEPGEADAHDEEPTTAAASEAHVAHGQLLHAAPASTRAGTRSPSPPSFPSFDAYVQHGEDTEDDVGVKIGVLGGAVQRGEGDGWTQQLFVIADPSEDEEDNEEDRSSYSRNERLLVHGEEEQQHAGRTSSFRTHTAVNTTWCSSKQSVHISEKEWILDELGQVERERQKLHEEMRKMGMKR